ncbi:STAS domain-containing protein [Streptomyces orinoci]|uniref:STAS domain-containing protein n=1 Tax=Streptomyces orinoci TaxID=67339 RepID=A0ABV3K3D2_STRON|nr:STAS domain-containing protein [Streptomyces orinoci]
MTDLTGWPPYRAALDVWPLCERAGLGLSGEVSLPTRVAWEGALATLPGRPGRVYLELSLVTFVDVAGTAALAFTAQRLGSGRRLIVDRPPPSMRRALEAFWSDLPAIEVTL